MALGPRLDLRQSQTLVMTPQLQQAIKLLAASNLEIEAFIAESLEANPLLEAGAVSVDKAHDPENPVAGSSEEPTCDQLIRGGEGEGDAPLDIDAGALDRDRDTGDGSHSTRSASESDWASAAGGGAGGEDASDIAAFSAATLTLAEHLGAQIGAATRSEREALIAGHIIGRLDDAGYLLQDIDGIADDLGCDPAEVEQALAAVQSLDPSGIGARDLSECLAIQAREADRYDPCMKRLLANLDLVARGEIKRLRRLCDVDDEDLADMLRELRSYDPKPGLAFLPSSEAPIVPDILLKPAKDGGWDIELNEETLPRLIVNRDYYLALSEGAPGKEAQGWLKDKLADAHWLIRALDQRQKTILKTAAAIVKHQEGFFLRGVSELRPLTLREVAEDIEMHESTVSRVTTNKYLHCERGCFELKYFFSSGVSSSDGEGASAEAIKARIRALTGAEDAKKVLSDQKLADMLNAEGFDLARRTVAKYREAIGIGSSAQRRRAKKLSQL